MRKQQKINMSEGNIQEELDNVDTTIDLVIENLRKKYGLGAAFRGGEETKDYGKDIISTGLLSLDLALGIGGVPVGRLIEIFGPETCGKSNLALKIAAEALKNNYFVFFVDLEHTLDSNFAENTGVDIRSKKFVISQPDYGEQAFDIIETVLSSGAKSLIVVDSVAALLPKSELESSFLDNIQPGRQAALMSSALRRIVGQVSKSNCTIVFINQTRSKIGSFYLSEDTPGGKALKFYSSIRLKVIRTKTLELNNEKIGHIARIRVEKNKLAAPFRECSLTIFYGSGFSSMLDIIDHAVKLNIVSKSGVWYSYKDKKVGQGVMQVLSYFIANPDDYNELVSQIVNIYESKYNILLKGAYKDKAIIYGTKCYANDSRILEENTEIMQSDDKIEGMEA